VKAARTLLLVVVALCTGAALCFGYMKFTDFKLWGRIMGPVQSAAPEEIMVMRTQGGLLEVSRISATEAFDAKFAYTFLAIPVGETISRIRLPAVYRYHIELAPEWPVHRSGEVFTVIAPKERPSLPVAVDLGRMEKESSGIWSVFTGTDDLNDLERSITGRLATKAVTPAYIQLQREPARKTVTEFVKKWLVTQTQWKDGAKLTIRVRFADEPEG